MSKYKCIWAPVVQAVVEAPSPEVAKILFKRMLLDRSKKERLRVTGIQVRATDEPVQGIRLVEPKSYSLEEMDDILRQAGIDPNSL